MSQFSNYVDSLHRCQRLRQPLWGNPKMGMNRLISLLFKELPALESFQIGNDTNRSYSEDVCLWAVNNVTLERPASFHSLMMECQSYEFNQRKDSFNSFLVEINLNLKEFQTFTHAMAPLTTEHLSHIHPSWEFYRPCK